MTLAIPRSEAIQRIAGHLTTRDSYIIVIPPDLVPTLAAHVANIPEWTAYLDGGAPEVLTTSSIGHLAMATGVVPCSGILTIPKTVHRKTLNEAFDVPSDGSQDIVIFTGAIACLPRLFVDALDIADPVTAAKLRAMEVPGAISHSTPTESARWQAEADRAMCEGIADATLRYTPGSAL